MKLKKKKDVLAAYPQYRRLINAVVDDIGIESIPDVINHGIDGGFGSFIYYSDTIPFAHKHQRDIVKMLEEQAEQMGEDVVTMVSHFGTFRRSPMDNEDKKELYRYLSYVRCKEHTIPNLMAWYAAEEVCRMFEE